jgi:mannose-1-phosphate guanylyltransferase
MKIKPVIMCGGAGTRLWPQSKNNLPSNLLILVVGLYLKKLSKG